MIAGKRKLKKSFAKLLLLLFVLHLLVPLHIHGAPAAAKSKSMVGQGMDSFKDSFAGVGTPSWLLTKFGIQMGYHLLDCYEKEEKPDVIKVVKSMTTADYLARSAGGLLGGAAGCFFIPMLSAVPVFGGLLANFVSNFAYYLGADMAGSALKGYKDGKFSFKNYFKNLDWSAMAAGSAGWMVGSMLGATIFPPLGGIVGGMLGDLFATRILDKFRKWRGQTDVSPPQQPGIGGPVPVNRVVDNSARSPEIRINAVSSAQAASVADIDVNFSKAGSKKHEMLPELHKTYNNLYEEYNKLVSHQELEKAAEVSAELRRLKAHMEYLRSR